MFKPIIGITTNLLYRPSGTSDGKYTTHNNQEYDLAIIQGGGLPILLPLTSDPTLIQQQVSLCDGILLAGGDDINPLLYGEEPLKALGETNTDVDIHHLALVKCAIKHQKPILGICRGMQLLNIACGGNVHQDLSDYPRERFKHSQLAPRSQCCHTITTEDDSLLFHLLGPSFPTNSFHHQALHRLGTNISATAWSKDRIIEGIELSNYPFGIGVQWHPEIMLQQSSDMLPLFKAFIEACSPKI